MADSDSTDLIGAAASRFEAAVATPVTEGDPAIEARHGRIGKTLGRVFPALLYRDFRLLWLGNVGSQLAFWMEQTVQGWLVYEMTRSPFYLSLVGFFRSVPMVVVSPAGGVMADRFDRRRVLVIAQIGSLAVALSLSALIFSGRLEPWHLLVAATLSGIAQASNFPARQALLASLVAKKHMVNAIGLHSTSLGGSRIVGPQVAGVLLAVTSAGVAYAVQAAAYFWAIINVVRIRTRHSVSATRSASFLANLGDGLKLVASRPALRAVLLIEALVSILLWSYTLFLPAIAKDTLHVGAEGLGVLMGASGVGALIGAFGSTLIGGFRRKGLLLLAAYFSMGLTIFLFSLSRDLVLSVILLAGGGLGSGVGVALGSSILQLLVPDEFRGRLSSIQMLVWGLLPIGTLPMGVAATFMGTPFAVGAASFLGMVGVMAVWVFVPVVRRIEC